MADPLGPADKTFGMIARVMISEQVAAIGRIDPAASASSTETAAGAGPGIQKRASDAPRLADLGLPAPAGTSGGFSPNLRALMAAVAEARPAPAATEDAFEVPVSVPARGAGGGARLTFDLRNGVSAGQGLPEGGEAPSLATTLPVASAPALGPAADPAFVTEARIPTAPDERPQAARLPNAARAGGASVPTDDDERQTRADAASRAGPAADLVPEDGPLPRAAGARRVRPSAAAQSNAVTTAVADYVAVAPSDVAMQIALLVNAEMHKTWPNAFYIPLLQRREKDKRAFDLEAVEDEDDEDDAEAGEGGGDGRSAGLARLLAELAERPSRRLRRALLFAVTCYAAVLDTLATQIIDHFTEVESDEVDENDHVHDRV